MRKNIPPIIWPNRESGEEKNFTVSSENPPKMRPPGNGLWGEGPGLGPGVRPNTGAPRRELVE